MAAYDADYYPGKYIYKSQGGSLSDPVKTKTPTKVAPTKITPAPSAPAAPTSPVVPVAPASPYNDMLAQLEKAKAEREKRLQAAKQAQLGAVDQQYNDLAQQAYIQKMQAMQNLPTQLALTGQTGGLSETATLAPQLAYGNALSAYGRDRANRAAQINAAIDEQSLNSAEEYDNQIYNLRAAEAQRAYENQLAAQKAQNDYAVSAYKAKQSGGVYDPGDIGETAPQELQLTNESYDVGNKTMIVVPGIGTVDVSTLDYYVGQGRIREIIGADGTVTYAVASRGVGR